MTVLLHKRGNCPREVSKWHEAEMRNGEGKRVASTHPNQNGKILKSTLVNEAAVPFDMVKQLKEAM